MTKKLKKIQKMKSKKKKVNKMELKNFRKPNWTEKGKTDKKIWKKDQKISKT